MSADFFAILTRNAEAMPDHVALQVLSESGSESFTMSRIRDEVAKISRFLSGHIQPGDTVGILMENHPRWGISFLAAESAGARIVPFDILHSSETLAELLRHSDCRYVISSQEVLPKLREIQALLPDPLPGLIAGPGVEDYAHWDSILQQESAEIDLPLVPRDPDETFLLVYTSGTTGNPKGVMLTPRSVYLTVDSVAKSVELAPHDHILSVLPLYHMLALTTNFLIPLSLGARVTYLDALEAQRILQCFRDEAITIFVCVPQFYYLVHRRIFQEIGKKGLLSRSAFKLLFKASHLSNEWLGWNPGKFLFRPVHRNFGSLRLFAVGGARFDPQVLFSFRDLGFTFAQAFGMTETSAVTTMAYPGGLGSVGRALPHSEIRISEPDSAGIGEVLIKGPHLMQGYWKNETATLEVLSNGWLHSGDLGYLDSDGYLHITGRKKDVIVLSSGKNIYPEEIEHSYQTRCPYIKEMCVIGVEGEQDQETLHAIVVPDFDYIKAKQVVNVADMIRYQLENLSQELPSYKRVRSFDIRQDALPRTPTRKIKRFEVEKQFRQDQEARSEPAPVDETPARNPVEERLFQLLQETGKVPVVNRTMNLEFDCGFDSLERVEFLSNVQDAFGISIGDDEAMTIFTVEDLSTAVAKGLVQTDRSVARSEKVSWAEILDAPLTEEETGEIHRVLRRRPVVEACYFFLSRCIWILGKLFFRLRFEGQEHLRQAQPHMICPNHLSYVDAFMISAGLPFSTVRRMFYVGYSDYFQPGSLTGYLGSLIKILPVDPDRNLRKALRLGAYGLKEQLVLGIFPEGERSIDGELRSFRKGPAVLARELGVVAIPTALIGTFQVWSRGSSRFRLHPVTVRFGKPIEPQPDESLDEFNARLKSSVKALLEGASQ